MPTNTGQFSRYSDWLRAGRPRDWISSPWRGRIFLHVIQTLFVGHPASYTMGTGGVNWPVREADHSSLTTLHMPLTTKSPNALHVLVSLLGRALCG
jgi:hypothetical protein